MADDPQVDPLEELAASHVEYRRHVLEGINSMIFPRDDRGVLLRHEASLLESERLNAYLEQTAIRLMQAREAARNQVQDPPPVEPDPNDPYDPNHAPAGTSSPPQGSDHESENDENDTHEVTRFDVWLAKHPKLEGFVEKVKPRAAKLWHHHGDKLERGFTP